MAGKGRKGRGAATTSTTTVTTTKRHAVTKEKREAPPAAQAAAPAPELRGDVMVEVAKGEGAHGRRFDRRPWTARVEMRGGFSSQLNPACTTNLSSGGVFVETPLLLEVGDPVVLTFRDERTGELLKIGGRVRWVTPFGSLDDPRPGMGIEFTSVEPERRRRIEQLLARLPARADP